MKKKISDRINKLICETVILQALGCGYDITCPLPHEVNCRFMLIRIHDEARILVAFSGTWMNGEVWSQAFSSPAKALEWARETIKDEQLY